jgi:pimeloyl-ACP methyl ester carboxylesterase
MAGSTMLPLAERLEGQLSVLLPDQPGFGESAGAVGVLGPAAMADALAEWLDALGVPAVGLLGCSVGAQIAVEIGARHPERVAAAVLASPTFDPHGATIGACLLRWVRNARHEQGSLGALVFHYRHAGLGRVIRTFRLALRHDMAARLPALRAPTLVVRGALDPIVPQGWAERVTQLLPKGELAVIPGRSHSLDNQAAQQLAELAAPFLRRWRASGGGA